MTLDHYVKMRLYYRPGLRPHLVETATGHIAEYLTKESNVLEAGAGASTIWFSTKAAAVVSFEKDRAWHNEVKAEIEAQNIKNVTLIFAPTFDRFKILNLRRFDIILIDGRDRVRWVRETITKLKPGGLFILDDSQRPRYKEATNLLDSTGMHRTDFIIGDSNRYKFQPKTSIWRDK